MSGVGTKYIKLIKMFKLNNVYADHGQYYISLYYSIFDNIQTSCLLAKVYHGTV